jgi:hypothetical protein
VRSGASCHTCGVERFVAAQPSEAFRTCGVGERVRGSASPVMRVILDVARVVGAAVFACACSSAAPLDLGSDDIILPESGVDSAENPDSTLESGSQSLGVVEPFMGGATGRCQATFQPCGGTLTGTAWVIEDTCTLLGKGNKAIQLEGTELLGLDPEACDDVVESLTSKWSGELTFEEFYATERRLRQRRFDFALGSECFASTFGVDASEAEVSSFCTQLGKAVTAEGSLTNCVPAAEGCRCTAETLTEINNRGTFGFWETYASITGERYTYCVSGNRLMWSDPGTNTHIVMRRRDAAYIPPEMPDDPR